MVELVIHMQKQYKALLSSTFYLFLHHYVQQFLNHPDFHKLYVQEIFRQTFSL